MIELERDRLTAPTVNAGVRFQIENYLAPVLIAPAPHIGGGPANVVRLVLLVVPLPIGRLTPAAIEVERSPASV